MAAAGAAGREDGGAGEGRRRPARPQWRSLREAGAAGGQAAGEGTARRPPCQRTRAVRWWAPSRAQQRACGPRRALAGRAAGLAGRAGQRAAVPAPSSGGRRAPPRLPSRGLPGGGGARHRAGSRPPGVPDPAPRSRCPGRRRCGAGLGAARRARVCRLGRRLEPVTALRARCSPEPGGSWRKGLWVSQIASPWRWGERLWVWLCFSVWLAASRLGWFAQQWTFATKLSRIGVLSLHGFTLWNVIFPRGKDSNKRVVTIIIRFVTKARKYIYEEVVVDSMLVLSR